MEESDIVACPPAANALVPNVSHPHPSNPLPPVGVMQFLQASGYSDAQISAAMAAMSSPISAPPQATGGGTREVPAAIISKNNNGVRTSHRTPSVRPPLTTFAPNAPHCSSVRTPLTAVAPNAPHGAHKAVRAATYAPNPDNNGHNDSPNGVSLASTKHNALRNGRPVPPPSPPTVNTREAASVLVSIQEREDASTRTLNFESELSSAQTLNLEMVGMQEVSLSVPTRTLSLLPGHTPKSLVDLGVSTLDVVPNRSRSKRKLPLKSSKKSSTAGSDAGSNSSTDSEATPVPRAMVPQPKTIDAPHSSLLPAQGVAATYVPEDTPAQTQPAMEGLPQPSIPQPSTKAGKNAAAGKKAAAGKQKKAAAAKTNPAGNPVTRQGVEMNTTPTPRPTGHSTSTSQMAPKVLCSAPLPGTEGNVVVTRAAVQQPVGLTLLKDQSGKTVVEKVLPGTPAARSHLQPKMEVTRVNGKPVKDISDMKQEFATQKDIMFSVVASTTATGRKARPVEPLTETPFYCCRVHGTLLEKWESGTTMSLPHHRQQGRFLQKATCMGTPRIRNEMHEICLGEEYVDSNGTVVPPQPMRMHCGSGHKDFGSHANAHDNVCYWFCSACNHGFEELGEAKRHRVSVICNRCYQDYLDESACSKKRRAAR